MKYLKYLLIIMLMFSSAIVSCKKDSTTGSESGEPIVGTWNLVVIKDYYLVTTNSDQIATAPFGNQNINISENTPTQIQYGATYSDGTQSISFDFGNDGTLKVIQVDNGVTYPSNHTYSLDGNQLIVNGSGGFVGEGVKVFEYSIAGNSLTIINTDYDPCDDQEVAECFSAFEGFLNLTAGSLIGISEIFEIVFSRNMSM